MGKDKIPRQKAKYNLRVGGGKLCNNTRECTLATEVKLFKYSSKWKKSEKANAK
jgi:hypothetical protein